MGSLCPTPYRDLSPTPTPSRAGTPSADTVRPSSPTGCAMHCTGETQPPPASCLSAVPARLPDSTPGSCLYCTGPTPPLCVELTSSLPSFFLPNSPTHWPTRTSSCRICQTFTCIYPEIYL